MPEILNSLKKYGSVFGKGIVQEMVPGIASGMINELFHQWQVDVAMITQLVQNNQSLWDGLTPETRAKLGEVVQKIENLDFITPSFLITSIKGDFSSVASLFLNWPEAAEWLNQQIIELKSEVTNIEPSQ